MLMNKKLISIFILLICFLHHLEAQNYFVNGYVKNANSKNIIASAEIYDLTGSLLSISNKEGYFNFNTSLRSLDLVIFTSNYKVKQKKLQTQDSVFTEIMLEPLSITLNEVEINEKKQAIFALSRLEDVVGTSIFAGKKTEVILISKSNASLALNNARQIYSQVAGLNIFQNDDAGLQLNIGGRGLDPNRTSNFNTRQNGYDISADVLGYPESYYTPPAEALEKIEVIRGAASLQYGTQFGGLINLIIKKPSQIKGNKFCIRNTAGSNSFYNNFTSVDGSNKAVSYYAFLNYKKGNGFRENSNFESSNSYINLTKNLNKKLTASFEFTLMDYLAKQSGGLNDRMFTEDPLQSNRTRNWFKVNWILYNFNLNYRQSENTLHTLSLFGLDAKRSALGYRSNRVDQEDPMLERDLIYGEFDNYGLEYKTLFRKKIKNINTASLLGLKLYKSNNSSQQGPGSESSEADFNFYTNTFPAYPNQSSYEYPNTNIALFGESIFYLSESFSITPGLRFEYIDTKSDGNYKKMLFDNANNLISDTTIYNKTQNKRDFVLFGLGLSYKNNKILEYYANISQNYRSVTFADISIFNPAYVINPNIKDEKGYTADIGVRGNINNFISYDINSFYLMYEKRIGFMQKLQNDGNVKSERGNIGDAKILGIESLIDINISRLMPSNLKSNYYINTSFIESEYITSEQNGIKGNSVEFVPAMNIKTGINLKYKSINSSLQLTYLSQQYTDASNSIESNLGGVIGEIPEYSILDMSFSYSKKIYKIETGINNLLNQSYFTRRATGYPGPGIIPSPLRNYYLTLEFNI
jgi:Fe(3+) dicitrate transport protein